MPDQPTDEHPGIAIRPAPGPPTAPAPGPAPDPASLTSARRLDWLDALRGWAVLGVVVVHAGEASHATGSLWTIAAAGQYGVQLFFLVSALTISLTYESHIRKFGASPRSQFAWFLKRFFRIAPLYYLAAIFYPMEQYAVYRLSHHHYGSMARLPAILANLLFVHTWIPSANNSVVPGGWSIGVEMFFYTLVPIVWVIKPPRPRVAVLAVGAVACLALTLIAAKVATGSYSVQNNSYLYYWFPAQAPVIILGLIFYLLRGPALAHIRRARHAIACLAGALLCFTLGLCCGTAYNLQPILAPSILAVAFLLLILAVDLSKKSALVNAYAIQLGRISFSVYIVHFVVLDLVRAAILAAHMGRFGNLLFLPVLIAALAISGLIAAVTKRIIEDPGIAYGHKLSLAVASDPHLPTSPRP